MNVFIALKGSLFWFLFAITHLVDKTYCDKMLSEVFSVIIYVNKHAMTTCNKAYCQRWCLLYRYPTIYFLNLSYRITTYPTLHNTLLYPTLPYYPTLLQTHLNLPCPALPCPALPCPALPCPRLNLPCPALPCPAPHTNSNPTMHCFVAIN